jgi:hypothetical protein
MKRHGSRFFGCVATLFCLSIACARAQIVSNWTQRSLAGDASTAGESSAAVAIDANYMFVADNEHETLRLFTRYPSSGCVDPVYSTNMRPNLNLTATNPEDDLEAAVRVNSGGTNRIYWLGSHSNSKSGGNVRPNRFRLFATTVLGNGSGSPPYSLAYVGRYEHLRSDLCVWDAGNQHGLGANYFGLAASTNGVPSESADGFNLEGLCLAPDGVTAYLGFRTPLVHGSGATTTAAQRTNALIVPLLNLADLVTNSPVPGPGKARFGAPFTLNLGKRGIRSLDSSFAGNYLITAGPPGDTSVPPVAPSNFCLFTWTGYVSNAPIERLTTFPDGYSPEGAVLPAAPIASNTVILFVSDDTAACWKSFTALAGVANQPVLAMLAPSNNTTRFNLLLPTTQTVTIEYSTNLANWLVLRALTNTVPTTLVTDAPPANFRRFYRARF